MKLLFILLATICFATVNCNIRVILQPTSTQSSESKSDGEMNAKSCAEEYNVDEKKMDDMTKTINFSATDEMKAFASCVAKRTGMMNEDGSLNKTFMVDNQDVIKCNKSLEGKDNQPDTAAKFIECLLREEQTRTTN